MHPWIFFPQLISLYARRNQKVCIFFTIVLAMIFDGLFATQQIHQEEQALEIKEHFLLEFSELFSLTIKQTPHKLCDNKELILPFFKCFASNCPLLLSAALAFSLFT